MQFVRMQVTGFKSFVEPTAFEFLPGLTGIVGPNGCGKSNLVEALRWAMGEGSARQVRGGEMDEMIFCGSDNRPARNLAEVILTLDNSDRRAPPQFNDSDELNVIRQIERGRGSSYRINGQEVRQRDVMTLFADAATGARSAALVSQGRIGAIIGAKPADRRALLEEAAGINGLYSRRQEAETRLRAAQTNLERLDDVIAAQEAQFRILKRQARQAARYRNLTESIRQQEAIVLHLNWSEARSEHDEAMAARQEIDQQVIELTRSVTTASTTAAEIEAVLPALKIRQKDADAALQNLSTAIRILDGEEQRIEARQRDIEREIAQIGEDTTRQSDACDSAKRHAQRLVDETAELEAALGCNDQELKLAAEAVTQAGVTATEAENTLEELARTVTTAETRAATLRQQSADYRNRRNKLEARRIELATELERARAEAGHSSELEEARAYTDNAESARNAARNRLTDAEEHTARLRTTEEEAKKTYERAAAAAAGLRTEVTALSELLKTAGSDCWPPVVDVIEVDTGYEVALGAALGDDLDAPIDADSPVHWRILPDHTQPPALPLHTRPLTAHVRGPAALQRRLSQIGLIDDDADGPLLREQLMQGQRLVSRSGAMWRWDGLTVAAGTPAPAAKRLEQRNRLEKLRKDLSTAEIEEARARVCREQRGADVKAAHGEENTARAMIREANQRLESARARVSKLVDDSATARSRAAGLAELQKQLQADFAELDEQESVTARERAELPDISEQQALVARQRSVVDRHRKRLEDLRRRHARLEQESSGRKRRLDAIPRERQSWERQIRSAVEQLENLQTRRQQTESRLEEIVLRPRQIQHERSDLIARQDKARQQRAAAVDDVVRTETQLEEAVRTLRELERRVSDARVERERKQTEVTLHAQEMSRTAQTARERLQSTPETLLTSAGLDPAESLPSRTDAENRLERLRGERHGLGEVNLRVETELAALNEQIRGMIGERDDLTAAISKLRQGISGLNREGRARLLNAFEQAERHFHDLFVSLFDGGQAKLKLTDCDDPLEAGLEVLACPPGKRMQNLSLMSGGEQALTALALLFTMFLINPAPVCVLDEVDAPLDSDNVGRFCGLLDRLAGRLSTKFLIVTHNSQTMARVDHLYGVTMPESGVSQLVSVDLQTADRLAEAA